MKSFEEWFNTPCADYTPVDIDIDKGYVTLHRTHVGVDIEILWDGEYTDCFERLISFLPLDSYFKVLDKKQLDVFTGDRIHTLYSGDILTFRLTWQ